MEEFLSFTRENRPFKVYKRKFGWTPQDVLYNIKLMPYYRKFLEVRLKTIELALASQNSKTTEERRDAIIAVRKHRLNSRKILGDIKNECTGN